MAKIPKRARILVNGTLFNELTKEHQEKIIQRNTEVLERIVSSVVMKMINDGNSDREIREFLGMD